MATELLTAIITASGAVAVAGASYWFTKKREREAELRKEKLAHYKDFVACLSGVISGEFTPDGQRAFALACNKLNLIAPQSVIRALQEFQEEIKISNDTKSQEAHDRLMSELLFEMRKDLGVKPGDERSSLTVGLWESGQLPAKI
ncbi:hypothetical protein [Microbulbifer halophilus]|uniref:DUF2489 domain-containing protein n=1 Tax=Microbulbifer halophilus TaxID=453963 RepID=A0ABW5ECL6_9GAMM|nr:hypothetical protein [Microbulbifer halophilus]MCW8126455.1 hypothetical protein [Microbulbifer halophilus]